MKKAIVVMGILSLLVTPYIGCGRMQGNLAYMAAMGLLVGIYLYKPVKRI